MKTPISKLTRVAISFLSVVTFGLATNAMFVGKNDYAFTRPIFLGSTSDWSNIPRSIDTLKRELASGSGPVVFFVSGFSGCGDSKKECISRSLFLRLRSGGFSVYDFEWSSVLADRTFGFDGLKARGDADFRKQMKEILSVIPDSRPIIFIGHSFGGDSSLKAVADLNGDNPTKKIALLAVLDGAQAGGFRTDIPVSDNVDYFFNRWTENRTAIATVNANMTGALRSRSRVDDQDVQSVSRNSQGKANREQCGGINIERNRCNKKIDHSAMPADEYIQEQLFRIANNIKLSVDPPSGRDFALWFRQVDEWKKSNYIGGFPNFNIQNGKRGTILLSSNVAEWRDISLNELGNPNSDARRLFAANVWAKRNGYVGAFPNYQQGEGVYGTILLKQGAAQRKEIPISELDKFNSLEERFRAVDAWAYQRGYRGFPTLNWTGRSDTIEVVLIKQNFAEWQDVSVAALQNLTQVTSQTNATPNTRQATPLNPIVQGDGVINPPSTIATINPPITSSSVTQWKVEGLGLVTSVSTNNSKYIDINRRVAFNTSGMTEEQALDRLSRIPIFTIVDDKDVPLFSNQIPQLVPFYLRFSDARLNFNPVPDRKERIIVRTMRDAFQIIRQNQNNKKIDFQFIADRGSKRFSRALFKSQRIEGELPSIPVFYAIYGDGNKQNLLTMSIKENGKTSQTIPFFFELVDLQELISRISKVQPEIKKNTKIQVTSLFHVLELMQTKDNNFPETDSFRFVPSSVALEEMLKMQK